MFLLLLLLISYTLFFGIFALFNARFHAKLHGSFSAMMFCISLLLVELGAIELERYDFIVNWFWLSSTATLCIPGLFYIYLRSNLRMEGKATWLDGIHFIIPILALTLFLPFVFETTQNKQTILSSLQHGETLAWYFKVLPTREIRIGLIAVLGAIYLPLNWHEFYGEPNRKKTDSRNGIRRFSGLISSMAIAYICMLVFFMFRLSHQFNWMIGLVLTPVVFLSGVFYLQLPHWQNLWLKQPAKDQALNTANESDISPIEPADPVEQKKYRSSVTTIEARLILNKIKNIMEAGIYKNANLTQRKLANELELSTHHLSQIINQNTQGSYYDLVNQYRIKEAKRLLQKEDISILDVAYESGFNSKTTFYTEFKKHLNCTPGQYRQSQLN